jgi:hypothetical protein
VLGLLRHPGRWPALKQAARDFVEKKRNWRESVAGYRAVYGELLKRGLA